MMYSISKKQRHGACKEMYNLTNILQTIYMIKLIISTLILILTKTVLETKNELYI